MSSVQGLAPSFVPHPHPLAKFPRDFFSSWILGYAHRHLAGQMPAAVSPSVPPCGRHGARCLQSHVGLNAGARTLVFNFCSRWEKLRQGICFTCFHTCESILVSSTKAKPPRKEAGMPIEERVQSPGLGVLTRAKGVGRVCLGRMLCVHTPAHTCTFLYTCIYMYIHIDTCIHMHTETYIHVHTYTCMCTHLCTHTCGYTY